MPTPPEKQSTQISKFIEVAKEHGCDENEKTFENKLKKIAKSKPAPVKKKKGD